MIRIDDTLLEEIGLISLPKAERDQMLRQIYETLEMRVGMRLAERMTDQQLNEFERFIDTNDEAGALKWLETNFPDYKQVVADELNKLKEEIKKDSNQILQAMQGQVGQGAHSAAAQQLPSAPAAQPLPSSQPQPASFGPQAPVTSQPVAQPPQPRASSYNAVSPMPTTAPQTPSSQQPVAPQPMPNPTSPPMSTPQPFQPPQPVAAIPVDSPQPQQPAAPIQNDSLAAAEQQGGAVPPPPPM